MATKSKTAVPKQSNSEPDHQPGAPVPENERPKSMSGIFAKYDNNEVSLDSIFEGGDVVPSSGLDLDIFKDQKLDSLIGVPFVVMGGTFRERIVDGHYSDFVTLICAIAPESFLLKRKIRYQGTEIWFPEQVFGINDGSTGIRRQIVAHLHNKGIIQATEKDAEIIESGKRGECTWDTRLGEWNAKNGDHEITADKETGADLMVWDFALESALVAPKGIRKSEYPGRYGKPVITRYLG
jgi:hypothetical protein